MTARKEAVLSLIVDEPAGMHPGGWREPGTPVDPAMNLERLVGMAQTAERAKFHLFFLADSLGHGMDSRPATLARTASVSRFEPMTLAVAVALATSRIGVAVTSSTSYNEPYNLARQFASLDHLSGGRAAWNVVTSNASSAPHFNDVVLGREERYARAAEFLEVVEGLWDSLDDDAFSRDKDSGLFFDPAKLHELRHRGKRFQVRGPLNIARPPQGHPVIAQAGSSPEGLAFAARAAEIFFVPSQDVPEAGAFTQEVRAKVAEAGRDPGHVTVLSSLVMVLGATRAEADARLARLDGLADVRIGIDRLHDLIDFDLSPYDLDGPVPPIPATSNASQTMQDQYVGAARREGLTVRQLAQRAIRFEARAMTPDEVVDHIEERILAGAVDGFNVSFADTQGSLDLFVDEVVPELRRRGLFRDEYRGATLRENLGLPRPMPRRR